jgi:hypothetical protein
MVPGKLADKRSFSIRLNAIMVEKESGFYVVNVVDVSL